jgi:hypothetical protein
MHYEIVDCIWVYCNYQQDNWKQLLPLTKFAYNNAPNTTMGISPFFANKGYNPSITVYPAQDLTSNRACEFTIDLDELHQELRCRSTKAIPKVCRCSLNPSSGLQSWTKHYGQS